MNEIKFGQLDNGRWAAKRNGLIILTTHSEEELVEKLKIMYPKDIPEKDDWATIPKQAGPYWR